MFKELNSTRTSKECIRLEDLQFRKLKDFVGKTLYVDGFFFTNGDYGKQLVVVARDSEGGWKVISRSPTSVRKNWAEASRRSTLWTTARNK